MAAKKTSSRAQKAVTDVKRKNTASSTSNSKSSGKKALPTAVPEDNRLPIRAILAFISAGLFVLFLIIGIKPDGALLRLFQSILLGLIGKVGFYFSIPALLYIFVILVSSRKRPVKMRCFSLIAFVLMCGSIFHLIVNNQTFIGGIKVFSDLYTAGLHGYSGGIVCGGIAMIVRWACGNVISYIVFILGAIFTLLAAMNITIPSIVRAIRNRPRDNWDEDEFVEVRPEPAAVVVNHIANKRIEQKRQRREAQQMSIDDFVLIDEPAAPVKSERQPSKRAAKPQVEATSSTPVAVDSKASDMLSQIEPEIQEPVSAAAKPITDDAAAELSVTAPAKTVQADSEPIPAQMPVYTPNSPIQRRVQ